MDRFFDSACNNCAKIGKVISDGVHVFHTRVLCGFASLVLVSPYCRSVTISSLRHLNVVACGVTSCDEKIVTGRGKSHLSGCYHVFTSDVLESESRLCLVLWKCHLQPATPTVPFNFVRISNYTTGIHNFDTLNDPTSWENFLCARVLSV
jgi:hypothetical protein